MWGNKQDFQTSFELQDGKSHVWSDYSRSLLLSAWWLVLPWQVQMLPALFKSQSLQEFGAWLVPTSPNEPEIRRRLSEESCRSEDLIRDAFKIYASIALSSPVGGFAAFYILFLVPNILSKGIQSGRRQSMNSWKTRSWAAGKNSRKSSLAANMWWRWNYCGLGTPRSKETGSQRGNKYVIGSGVERLNLLSEASWGEREEQEGWKRKNERQKINSGIKWQQTDRAGAEVPLNLACAEVSFFFFQSAPSFPSLFFFF